MFNHRLSTLWTSAVLAVLSVSCSKTEGGNPSSCCTTKEAGAVTSNSAKLNGTVSTETYAQAFFYYSTEQGDAAALKANGTKLSVGTVAVGGGDFEYSVSGLACSTTYWYVASAIVDGRENFGEVLSFATLELPVEAVTGEATDITSESAVLYGQCKMEMITGASPEYGVEYSTTPDLSSSVKTVVAKGLDADQNFSCEVKALTQATKYYYRAFVKYDGKTHYGEIKSFETIMPFVVGSVGEPLPLWQEGWLDIHMINSGRGECGFYILPDGTTMLADAGEVSATGICERRPAASASAHETDGRYIQHFMPQGSTKLDYMWITHHHNDHMGDRTEAVGEHGYVHSGVMGVYDYMPMAKIVDRSYPDYSEAVHLSGISTSSLSEYAVFVDYVTKTDGVVMEKFDVGSSTQFPMVKAAKDKFEDKFRILNITGNGDWVSEISASGEITLRQSSPNSENAASCGIHMTYGNFDFLSCGDLVSTPQNGFAQYVASYVKGADVFKAHHHMNSNGWGSQMKATNFSPQVVLVQNFYASAPDNVAGGILEYVLTNKRGDVFPTNAHPDALAATPALYEGCKDYQGHFVVRVCYGGNEFYVYKLNDTDFNYKIAAIYGPYTCK